MTLYYSAARSGFFDDTIHIHLPLDAVEITPQLHAELLAQQSQGLAIVPDMNGEPMSQLIPATEEYIRAKTLRTINADREAALRAGVTVDGKTYHTDDRFLVQLMGMVMGYQVGLYPPGSTQTVRTVDNTLVQLTQPQIVALAGAVGEHTRQVYAASWTAKDAIA